jgi:hypothetical protein
VLKVSTILKKAMAMVLKYVVLIWLTMITINIADAIFKIGAPKFASTCHESVSRKINPENKQTNTIEAMILKVNVMLNIFF